MMYHVIVFFCFKQKTAYEMRISDWSSDVCFSDLPGCPGSKRPRNGFCSSPGLSAAILASWHDANLSRELCFISGSARKLGAWTMLINESFKIGRASCRERVCQYV